eukprot:12886468-Prorocentrum_lima.AAC.1
MMIVGKTCHPFDVGAPVFLVQEHTLEEEHRYPEQDEFLIHMEGEMNPRYLLHGSECVNFNPFSQAKTVQYDGICHFMHNCF